MRTAGPSGDGDVLFRTAWSLHGKLPRHAARTGTVHPLDAALGLRHRFSEGVEEVTAFTASQLTYEETAAVMEKALGLRLSQTGVQSVPARWGDEVMANPVIENVG